MTTSADISSSPVGTAAIEAGIHDVVVIGGGVVGCAVLRAFALAGLRPLMLECGPDILNGASKANSALLHTGYDAKPGSLELACVAAGYREYLDVHERLGLSVLKTSAIMVAWTPEETALLPGILDQAQRCGVSDVRSIGRDELRWREPHLAGDALEGILIPGEHVIDPWSAPLAYALQALANGAVIRRRCGVTGGSFEEGLWRLQTSRGEVRARTVINCAGLFGDLVEAICRPSPFTIKPRKGQFLVFDKPAAGLVRATILAVPNERTKGVLLARTAFGNLLLGPTAEEREERQFPAVDSDVLASLIGRGRRILPALADHVVTATFAGLRPATEHSDYQIEAIPHRRWVTVSGIRSTGLTGSLGIARYVRELYAEHFGPVTKLAEPAWVRVPNLCEHRPRPYQAGGYGEIVCHCEGVTRGELEDALASPLPAIDLGGLKRRTRCMLGRCQGFYCSGRIAELSAGRLDPPLATGIAP